MGCNCGKEQEKVHEDTAPETDFTLKWFKDNHDSTKMWGELAQAFKESGEVESDATKDLQRQKDAPRKNVEQKLISKERTKKCLNKLFQHLAMDMMDDPKEIPFLKLIVGDGKYKFDDGWRKGGMQRISEKVELNNQSAVELIFETIDEDKSGYIDKKEFTNLYGICDKFFGNYQHMKHGKDDESNKDDELMTRFGIMLEKILDQNHDGLVDEKEMSDALQKVGNNIYEVVNVWMGLLGLMAMEMMNGTIDKISKDRVKDGKTANLEWDEQAWGKETWDQNSNTAELSRYCCGLRAILENEETFQTIGEMFGLGRTQMGHHHVSLPNSKDAAGEILRFFKDGQKDIASFLLLMCPISMVIASLETMAAAFATEADNNPDVDMTQVEFDAVVNRSFTSPHEQISNFLTDLAIKMHPADPASPVKVGGGIVSAEGSSSPEPASPGNSSKEDDTIHRIFDILQETGTKKVLDKFMSYFVDQKDDLLQAFYRLLQFGRRGTSISKKQLVATLVVLMIGGAPIEDRPRLIFDAFDADNSKSVDPEELKAAVEALRFSADVFGKAITKAVHRFMDAQVFPAVSKIMMNYVPHGSGAAVEGAAAEGAAGQPPSDAETGQWFRGQSARSGAEGNTIVMQNVLMALTIISTKLDGKHGLVASMCKPILDFKYKKKDEDIKAFKKLLKQKVADQMSAKDVDARTDSTTILQLSILAALSKEIADRC
jgi:hypothetical protein